MRQFKTRIVTILFICCIISVSTLFYFMLIFDDQKFESNQINNSKQSVIVVGFSEIRKRNLTLKELYEKKVKLKLSLIELDDVHTQTNEIIPDFIKSLKLDQSSQPGNQPKELNKIWLTARKWVRARQVIPEKAPELSSIIKALHTTKIIKSDVSRKGTQLKILLTLEGGQLALFKPKRYARDYITDDIYSGADRHNGEIIAFHLSRILNMRYAPIVASRVLNVIKEIKSVASESLLKTFVSQLDAPNNISKECFYGECYYCNEYDLVCGDQNSMLEGAIILMLPNQYQLQKLRHPWQRTYKKNLKSQWELDSHYCYSVMKSHSLRPRVLDFVDASIFDYLIGNADRHHYEVFKDVSNSALLLIDNGKSFGDPNHDETTILFPLLQCCVIRNSTYQHLKMLSTHKLSDMIQYLLSNDILWPLITDQHLLALDRRLSFILASIQMCFDSYSRNHVLKN